MEKKNDYISPEVEIIQFDPLDIIKTSGQVPDPSTPGEGQMDEPDIW